MRILTVIIKKLFCKVLNKVNYTNIEILDKLDNCIICPNHSRVFDPIYVFPIEQEENIYVMAKSELFNYRFFRWLFNKYNVFPINREKTDPRSLLKSLNIFKENNKAKLIIFPEGRVIKEDSEIKKHYKKGPVFIAAHTNIPILPVYITRRPKLFQKIDVIFGEPIYITKDDLKGKTEMYSEELIKTIYDLKI